jgi:N-acetylmuramoyl-L-alanine amidase
MVATGDRETSIRTTTQTLTRTAVAERAGTLVQKRFNLRLIRRLLKSSKKRALRWVLLATHVVLLASIAGLVINGSKNRSVTAENALLSVENQATASALDQLSSTDIAVHLANVVRLEEAVSIVNQADSSSLDLTVPSADDNVIAKPQLVSTGLKSKKDIKIYTVVAGDSVGSLATKFGITSETIRWSNNLTGNELSVGKELVISPVNGLVYTVKEGDTPDSLARRFRANKDQLIAFNDAELTGSFKVGEKIVIPDGVIVTPVATRSSTRGFFAFGLSAIYGYNGYIPGWCTWYVASRISVPANWGNASTWDSGAKAAGWYVGPIPKPGAIAQRNGGQGHVAVVEEVSEDGTQIKYSDMNGIAGWGKVGFSDWVPKSKYDNYIYQ